MNRSARLIGTRMDSLTMIDAPPRCHPARVHPRGRRGTNISPEPRLSHLSGGSRSRFLDTSTDDEWPPFVLGGHSLCPARPDLRVDLVDEIRVLVDDRLAP